MYPIVIASGAVATLAVFVLSVALHYATLRLRRQERPAFGVARKAGYHLPHSLIAGWALAHVVLVLALGVFAVRSFGGQRMGTMTRPALHLAGAVTPSESLVSYAPPVLDQGAYNACGAFASTEALMTEYREMGRQFPYSAFSPWYTYYWSGNGGNSYTSFAGNAQSIINNGVVSLPHWPSFGYPPQSVQGLALREGASWQMLDGSQQQAARAIDLGYVPVILISIRDSFYNAFGASDTSDQGGTVYGTHFIPLLDYRRDGTGYDFLVQNSWGAGFGDQGRIWLDAAAWSQVQEVDVIAPGATTAWPDLHALRPAPAPQPTATATARPRPTATPRPRPTATSRPTPTATPLRHGVHKPHGPYYTMRRAQFLRTTPALVPTSTVLVPKGAQVKLWSRQVKGWHHVVYGTHNGWVLATNTR